MMNRSRGAWLLSFAIFLAALLWLFQDVIIRGRLVSFRDALQHHYPAFEYIQQEWEAGRPPLWNPYINGGEPLAASADLCLFYPLKLLFFLPGSFWFRYHLFLLAHYAIAWGTSAWMARRWGCSAPAAGLAGISYACCGNILFEYCNIQFLCGAAWLPLLLWSGDRLVRNRRLNDVPAFASLLALYVLMGDPQTGYVAGCLVALQGLFLWWSRRSDPDPSSDRSNVPAAHRGRFWNRRTVLLAASAWFAVMLSAVQMFPTLQVSRESIRATRNAPISLYDLFGLLRRRDTRPRPDTGLPPHWYDGLIGDPPPPATHESSLYYFSLEPWRVAEFLWPTIGGKKFPVDGNWLQSLNWQGPFWAPSQYMGLLPMLLAVSALKFRRTNDRTRWLSWIVLLSLLGSFGCYGPGRLFLRSAYLEEFYGHPHLLTGAVGGVYWLMVLLLPGFAQFRYPAKLLVFTAAGLSLLAGVGFDRFLARLSRRWIGTFLVLAGLNLLLAIAATLAGDALAKTFDIHRLGPNSAFSPASAVADIQASLWHATGIAWLLLIFTLTWSRWRGSAAAPPGQHGLASPQRPMWLRGGSFLVLTAVDLVFANLWMIETTDRAAWERPPELVSIVRQATSSAEQADPRPPRIYRMDGGFYSAELQRDLAGQDMLYWQRATLIGQQNLPFRIGMLDNVYVTMESDEMKTWFDRFPINDPMDPERTYHLRPRRAFDAWGAEVFILPDRVNADHPTLTSMGLRTRWKSPEEAAVGTIPSGEALDSAVPDSPAPLRDAPDVSVLTNDNAFPPAWIVHRLYLLTPIDHADRDEWIELTRRLVFPFRNTFDLRREAVIEDEGLVRELGARAIDDPPPEGLEETCRMTRYEPGRVELEATLSRRGLVVLSDRYSPDWLVSVSTNGAPFERRPLLQTNRTMRGVWLPAGTHLVRYEYRPKAFYLGAAVSLASVAVLLIWIGASRYRGRRRHAA